MFPIMATLFGVTQWFVLRKRFPKSGWWILATIVGMLAGIYIAGGVVQAISHITGQAWNWEFRPGLLTVYVLVGFLLALAQLPILWRHFKGSVL
jgi:MFS family permease